MAMWDVSDGNRGDETTSDIVRRVLRDARSGSIINLRNGIDGAPAADKERLVRALPAILDGLAGEAPRAGAARRARRRSRVHVV